jgi:cytochrome c-type biogenesis protein CcmH/NrfG
LAAEPYEGSVAVELPPNLVHAVQTQTAVLFLGAGASRGAIHPKNAKVPSGDNLRDLLSHRFLGGQLTDRPLATVAEYAVNESSLIEVQTFVKDQLKDFKPAPFHKLIPTFGWHGIATTNFDTILEQAYEATGAQAVQDLVAFVKNGQPVETEMKRHVNGVQCLKLHGCITRYTDQEIPLILATEQYIKYATNRTRLFERLRDWGTEFPIIFCGYSINDPNIQLILFDLFDLDRRRPQYYVVNPEISDIEQRYWASHRITGLRATCEEFFETLDATISGASRKLTSRIGGGQTSLRTFYRVAGVVESERLLSFLIHDADHVRRDIPFAANDPKDFYKGYDDGWFAIANQLDVHRAVTDSLVVDAVLAPEEGRPAVELFVLKGPGGNGKTIALKRAAWMAAIDYEKLVLFAKDGGALPVEVFGEIFDYVGQRIYLFADRAALRAEEIEKLVNHAQDSGIKLTVVTAERDAEWNVRCEDLDALVSKELPVKYLSEKEIRALVDKLEQHNSLGLLAKLDPEERVRMFVETAQRQLLVALHEVTLGKPFEDIVYDEYHRIVPNEAQKLYLDICTLNRLGVDVRAGLISRISNITFTDFQSAFFKPLEHIVSTRMDYYSGDYVYAARHQRVAEMVFDRVLADPEQRLDQILFVMAGMNIDYSSDHRAFSQLIRGRSVADAFPSQELGRRIYEVAVSVAGEEPYLLQQRAIFEMDHAGGSLELAERYLSKALGDEPYNKSIQHTFANLLRRQAVETGNPLLRKTLRDRARSILQAQIGKPGELPYSYHTLAQLALDNLRDVLSALDEAPDVALDRQVLDLAREAEQTIANGLQKHPQNEHLLTLEAQYRELVDQHQRALVALEAAFKRNPRLDWVASRLARSYESHDRIADAGDVLRKLLQENPSSKRGHFELAMFYMEHGSEEERKLVIEHLRRAFTSGDTNYDAQFWYARELFLTQQYDEAERMFQRLRRITSMSMQARREIRGIVSRSDGAPLAFEGTIERLEDAFLFVRSPDFPVSIFVHRSRAADEDWLAFRRGQKVRFTLGFNMGGPTAASIRS